MPKVEGNEDEPITSPLALEEDEALIRGMSERQRQREYQRQYQFV